MVFFGGDGVVVIVIQRKGSWWKEVVAPWALRHPLRRPSQKAEIRINLEVVDGECEM